jgi:hypothetical protein
MWPKSDRYIPTYNLRCLLTCFLQGVDYSAKVDHNQFERVLLIEEECIRRVILAVIEVAER